MAGPATTTRTSFLSLSACPPPIALAIFPPMVVAAVWWSAAERGVRVGAWAAMLLGGLVAWTLVEYLAHRFVFHIDPKNPALRDRNLHLKHHAAPHDPAYFVIPLWFSVPAAGVVWGVLYLLLADAIDAATTTSGTILGYLAYEWVHWRVHLGPSRLPILRACRKHHLHHHFAEPDRAFGFTTQLWDRLFRTMPSPKRERRDDGSDVAAHFRSTRRVQVAGLGVGLLLWPFAAPTMPYPAAFLVFDLVGLLTLAWLARRSAPGGPRPSLRLHVAVSYAIMPILYSQAGATAGALAPTDLAPFLADADRWLFFGHDPCVVFDSIKSPLLTEVMQWSYNLLWVMPLAILIALLQKGRNTIAVRGTLALVLTLGIVCAGLLVVPASGPGYHTVTLSGAAGGHATGPLVDPALFKVDGDLPGVFAAEALRRIMATTDFNPMSSFPSGHVALTLLCAALAFRVSRRFGWTFLPLAVAGVISTVYLRYHYAVDAVGGALAAAPAFWLTREPRLPEEHDAAA